jgi:ribosomal protein L44E
MRKQFKKKLRSCALCKPHKMGWVNRWKKKDQSLQKAHQREILKYQRGL